jgi:hypothetical protein
MPIPAPTTDQLRDRIDSGKTGEKIAFPDPAAAPLGTDAEAGNAPPTRQERAIEAAAQPSVPHRGGDAGFGLYAVLAGSAIILVLLAATLAS